MDIGLFIPQKDFELVGSSDEAPPLLYTEANCPRCGLLHTMHQIVDLGARCRRCYSGLFNPTPRGGYGHSPIATRLR